MGILNLANTSSSSSNFDVRARILYSFDDRLPDNYYDGSNSYLHLRAVKYPTTDDGEVWSVTEGVHGYLNISDLYTRERSICNIRKAREVTVAEIIACIIAILTVLENIVILAAITRGHRSLRKPPYYFIASLAVADLLTGIEVVLAIFIPIGDDAMSRIVLKGIAVVTFIASVNSLLLVSMDRYIRIVRHSDYSRLMSQRVIVLLILFSWLFSVGVFLAGPVLGWSCYKEHCCAYDGLCTCMRSEFGNSVCLNECSQSFRPFTKSYIIVGCTYFAVSVVTMSVFYYRIFKVVREKTFGGSDFKSKKREVQLAKTLVFTLGIFVFCWLPVQALFLADIIITEENEKLSKVFDYALVPSVLNSFMNPIIYSIRLPHMRTTIQRMFLPCIYGGQHRSGSAWVSSTSLEKSFRRFSTRRRQKPKSVSSSSDVRSPTPYLGRSKLMSNKSIHSENSLRNNRDLVTD